MIRPDDRSPEDRRQDAVEDAIEESAQMSMRDRMARDMCEAAGQRGKCIACGPDYGRRTCSGYMFRRYVDSALSTLLNPTAEMCKIAGAWGVGENGKIAAETLSKNAFIIMIRAAQENK